MVQLFRTAFTKGFCLVIKAIVVTFTILAWFGVNAHTLTVELNEIQVKQGTIMLAVFKGQQSYDEDGTPFSKVKKKVNDNQYSLVFTDLTEGDYAVKVLHDENDNGSLDTNFFGIPTEGYGFSNNGGSFGPASFDDAKFSVTQDTTITIDIR